MRAISLQVVVLGSVLGCSRGDAGPGKGSATAAPTAAPTGPAKDITISLGPKGQTRVEGAAPLHGDPKVCAALQSCCATTSDTSLFCALGQDGEGGDCAKLLVKVKQYAKEANNTAPACR
jgi:hypothetical protein